MISLRARQIKMEPVAQTSNGVTVNVSGVALVKIGSDPDPDSVRRAAERFASQDAAIEQFTTEQLEGALRGVVATLTVEELMRSEEHTSELQSLMRISYAVLCLKKKNKTQHK